MNNNPESLVDDQKPFVFISYSHEDTELVQKDLNVLREYRVRYWIDESELLPGNKWDEKVRSTISKSNCTGAIFYFSTNAIKSEQVRKELRIWYDEKYAQKNIYDNGQNEEVASANSQNHFAIMLDHDNFPKLVAAALQRDDKLWGDIGMIEEMFSSNKLYVVHPNLRASDSQKYQEYYDKILKHLDENGARDKIQTRGNYRCVYNKHLEGSVIFPTDLGTESIRILPDKLEGSHVVGIGDHAFKDDKKLYDITIQRGVRYIGKQAFAGCSKLFRITIPETVEEIGEQAFEDCTSLSELILPDNLRKLSNATFCKCAALKSINIPSKIERIPAACFKQCDSLYKIDFPDSLIEIGIESFSHCKALKTVFFRPSIIRLGRQAFANCISLLDVKIPSTLMEINEGVFEGCTGLVSAILQDCKATVARRMFANCTSLTTITLGDNIEQIREGAFENCKNLQDLRLPNSLKQLDDRIFFQCKQLTRIELPNALQSIGHLCFAGDSKLQTVKLPDSLIRIGSLAFANCFNIEFELDSKENPFFKFYEGVLYTADMKEVVAADATIRKDDLQIKDGVQIIRPGAFFGSPVQSIRLPNSLTDIGQYAFFGMPELIEITLPNEVNRIGNGNFSECKQLTCTRLPMNVKRLGGNLFRNCPKLNEIYYLATQGVQMGLCCFQSLPSMEKVYIKKGMKDKLVKMRGWKEAEKWMVEQTQTE